MVGDQEAWAAHALSLVSEEVAPLVVRVVGHHKPQWERRALVPPTRVKGLQQLLRLGARSRAHVEDLRPGGE